LQNKEGATDSSFSAIRDPTQFSVDKAKYSKVPEVFGSVFNFHSMLFSRTVCVALARWEFSFLFCTHLHMNIFSDNAMLQSLHVLLFVYSHKYFCRVIQ